MPPERVESQESQDAFADYDLDFDDPDLIAILDSGDAGNASVSEDRQKDAKIAEVVQESHYVLDFSNSISRQIMDTDITPAIYRLIIQHFNDPSISRLTGNRVEDFFRDADKWVDCWVGCAAVIVQNSRRVRNFIRILFFANSHCESGLVSLS